MSGLVANDPDDFELNGKKMKILGGSLHYFRVHPTYWRDRLRKYRAAGLNSISVYVNLGSPLFSSLNIKEAVYSECVCKFTHLISPFTI